MGLGLASTPVSTPTCASSDPSTGSRVLVTLDLPERRNMMSAEMTGSWGRVMADLRADASVRPSW